MKRKLTYEALTLVNAVVGAFSYMVVFGINFWLSPYIVKNIGLDAVGFVDLANNFINYALLITIALNTLSARFVSISIHRKDNKNANEYFSSVFFSNIGVSVAIALIGTLSIALLEFIFDIPQVFVVDVKILFAILFLNCILSTIGSVFSIATFTYNKLFLSSLATLVGNVVRALLLIGAFTIFIPKLYYVGIASVVATIITIICNIYFTKRLLPTLKLNLKYFRLEKVKELTAGGIWATVNRVGTILLTDLDLLVSNVFIDSVAMGILSISKTIPNIISNIVFSAVSVFSPNYTRLFAEEKYDELVYNVKQSIRIIGFFANLPIIVLLCCGSSFYTLWQPDVDADVLQKLSILAICCLIFSAGINCIYNIFTVVNKLKLNALIVVISGFISTGLVIFLLKTTDLGIYAIAGVSSFVGIIRNLVFTAPYGAKCLNQKWYVFYPDIFKSAVFVAVSGLVCTIICKFMSVTGWLSLFTCVISMTTISIIIGTVAVLNKEDRKMLLSLIRRRY